MNRGCIVDFGSGTITQTNVFARRAMIVNSPENKIIRELKKEFPDYDIKTKAPINREYYRGLTIEFMKKCVEKFYAERLAEFDEWIELFKGHPAFYAKMKKILFSKYPECKELIKAEEIKQNIEKTDDEKQEVIDEGKENVVSDEKTAKKAS
jgi:hypothetical protein